MAKRRCNNCREVVESSSVYCPKCGTKMKKKNKVLFFIIMSLVFFFVFEVLFTIFGGILMTTIPKYKYGDEILGEFLLSVFMIIVLLIFGNSYVFKEKKVDFFKGLLMAIPMLIFTIYILCGSIIDSISGLNIANVINLMVLCIGVGIGEEFLCRAWLQNEFMENFGSDKKGVVYSIICSSIVFAIMHITNAFFTTQSLYETSLQIIQALGSGFLFGAIYYKTKNIWINAFLHGFFDFAIMLSEVNLIKDCANEYIKSSDMILGIISSIIIVIFYLSCAYFALSSKNGEAFFKKKNLKKVTVISIIVCIISFGLSFVPEMFMSDGITVCYEYTDKVFNEVYEITTTNRKDYKITINDKILRAYINYKDYKKIVTLSIDDKKIDLIFDDEVEDYILVDNEDYIDILIHTQYIESNIYFGRIYKEDIDKLDTNFKDNLDYYKLPDLDKIGMIKFESSNNTYVYMESKLKEKFYIDDNIYLIK